MLNIDEEESHRGYRGCCSKFDHYTGREFVEKILDIGDQCAEFCFIEDFVLRICKSIIKKTTWIRKEEFGPDDLAHDIYVLLKEKGWHNLRGFRGETRGELASFIGTCIGHALYAKVIWLNPPSGSNRKYPTYLATLKMMLLTEEGHSFLKSTLGGKYWRKYYKADEEISIPHGPEAIAIKLTRCISEEILVPSKTPDSRLLTPEREKIFSDACIAGRSFEDIAESLPISMTPEEAQKQLERASEVIRNFFYQRVFIDSWDREVTPEGPTVGEVWEGGHSGGTDPLTPEEVFDNVNSRKIYRCII
jgi:hypothetical protein